MRQSVFTLQQRLIIFFAQNPEMRLTTAEVAHKFDESPDGLWNRMRNSVELGIFQRVRVRVPVTIDKAQTAVAYCAGPALLEELDYSPDEIAAAIKELQKLG